MRTGFLVLKIYREHPALAGEFMFPSAPPARVSRQPAGMAGELCRVPWDHGAGMWRLGGWRMGVLCSKALELEKNENERSVGSPADRRQATKKTASGLAHRLSWGVWSIGPAIPSQCAEDKQGALYKRGFHFYLRCYFLNKCHFQSISSLAHFVAESVLLMGSFSPGIWYLPEGRLGVQIKGRTYLPIWQT